MVDIVSSELLRDGRYFSFYHDVVRLPNGRETDRDIVRHPGAVAIVAVHRDEVVLIKQYRYVTGGYLFEIPAGTLEEGEDPYRCAVRELREETGYAASSWTRLFQCYMAPGYSDEVVHFYLAEGLTEVGSSPENDEVITVSRYGFNEVLDMIEANQIVDAKTMLGILRFLTRANL